MARRTMRALAALFAVLSAGAASAHLSIDKLWVDFVQGESERSDIVIRNDGKERYYVSVSVSEIDNPGTPEEKRVEQPDPEKAGLLVTPNRLILDPGALRSIRLVSLNDDVKQDRVYRVLVSPQIGAIQADQNTQSDARGLTIKMLASYDVLVVVKPHDAQAKLTATRTPTQVVFTNGGNSNILLADGLVCPGTVTEADASEKTCKSFDATRLYAGNSTTVAIDNPTDKIYLKTRTGYASGLTSQQF